MPESLIGITLDCAELDTVVAFWQEALGYVERRGESAGDRTFRTLFAPSDRGGLHHLTVQQVPERKSVKNRSHLDLFVEDVDAEVKRLADLGATVLRDEVLDDDVFRTIVMADPEGNEFCVVASRPRRGGPPKGQTDENQPHEHLR